MSYTTPEQYLAEVPWIDRPDADIDNHPMEPGLALDEPALKALVNRWLRNDLVAMVPGAAYPANAVGLHGGSTVLECPWGKPEGKLLSWFQASGA